MSGRSAIQRRHRAKAASVKGRMQAVLESPNEDLQNFNPDVETPFQSPEGGAILPRVATGYEAELRNMGLGYARAVNPVVSPILPGESLIYKTELKAKMDTATENSRNFISSIFTGDKFEKAVYVPPPKPPSSKHTSRSTTSSKAREAMTRAPPGQVSNPLPSLVLHAWLGDGNPVFSWNHLANDKEMWFADADTIVYVGYDIRGTHEPTPTLRVDSSALLNSGSEMFRTLLREGNLIQHEERNRESGVSGTSGHEPLAGYRGVSSFVNARLSSFVNGEEGTRYADMYTASVSPGGGSSSGGGSSALRASSNGARPGEAPPKYAIFLPPSHGDTPMHILEDTATNRNVFAKIYGKSIVGTDLLKALTDLEDLLGTLITPDNDNVADMVVWLTEIKMHNVQNRPSIACEVLAWSELPHVQWDEGWKEAFVHAVGMYPGITTCKQFSNVSRRTKTMLERANYSVKVRMETAEERIGSFEFQDLLDPSILGGSSTARVSFQKLETFFKQYYAEQYGGSWPPEKAEGSVFWLTRPLLQRLTEDFTSLYQSLVDREVVWLSGTSENPLWSFVSSREDFVADHPEVPMTAIFLGLDKKYDWPHIPYAYPLIPPSYSPSSEPPKPKLKKLFSKAPKTDPKAVANAKNREIAASLSYGYASNIMVFNERAPNDLLDRFCTYEKSLPPADFDPHFARRGHWFLIYAVLQVLAEVNVDSCGVRFKDKTSYPLCTRLNEKTDCFQPYLGAWDNDPVRDNRHEDSFCWTVPGIWAAERNQLQGGDGGRKADRKPITDRTMVMRPANPNYGYGSHPSLWSSNDWANNAYSVGSGGDIRGPPPHPVIVKDRMSNQNFSPPELQAGGQIEDQGFSSPNLQIRGQVDGQGYLYHDEDF